MLSIHCRAIQGVSQRLSLLALTNTTSPLLTNKAGFFIDRSLDSAKLPTRPANLYSNYVRSEFQTVKSQNPAMNAAEIMKIIAGKYNALPQSQKEVMKSHSQKAIDSYKQAIEKLKGTKEGQKLLEERRKETHGKRIKTLKRQIRSIKREANFPKKSGNGMTMFIQSKYDTFSPGAKATVRLSEGCRAWKSLSESEKQAFRNKAEEANTQATKVITEWKAKNQAANEEIEKAKKRISELRKLIRTDPNAPKPKPKRPKKVAKKIKKKPVPKKKAKKVVKKAAPKKKAVAKKAKKVVAKKAAPKKVAKKN